MAKELLTEHRFDFRGGRNVAVSPDLLNLNELTDTTNARLDTSYGGIAKRTGSRRMHATAIGSGNPIRGLFQWNDAGTQQLVAICNTNLYHKTSDFGNFTEVNPSQNFSTSIFTHFATFRDLDSSAALRLYLTSGGNAYSWTGSTLTNIDGTNSVPTAELIAAYHTRLFMNRASQPKHLFWSEVGDGDDFDTGDATDGGSAIVGILSGDEIVALETIGGSLLVATEDSIARFTGYSADDIQIAQDTEGVSAEVGAIGELALLRVENFGALMSDRGAYLVTEGGVSPVSFKVDPDFDGMVRTRVSNIAVGHHRGRREIWFAYTATGDSVNQNVLIYNYRLQQWYGPFTYPFGIESFARWEDSNGAEFIIAGCDDGFVRHLDTGALDDVLSDETGGSAYTMTVELAPYFFSAGPGLEKDLRRGFVQGDFPSGSALNIAISVDGGAFAATEITESGSGVQNYRVDFNIVGNRFRIRFTDASSVVPIVHGLTLEAFNLRRPS